MSDAFVQIYTHRPVADVGAFAPRDYVREAARKREGRASRHTLAQQATHVLGSGLPEALPASPLRSLTAATGGGGNGRTRVPPDWEVEMSAWYRRIENNGWRPLTERLAGQAAAGELGRVPRRQAHWPVLRAERKVPSLRGANLWLGFVILFGLQHWIIKGIFKTPPSPDRHTVTSRPTARRSSGGAGASG